MNKFYSTVARAYFVSATAILILLAFVLLALAIWEIVVVVGATDLAGYVRQTLSSISLLVIGFAVVETAKFIAEEEVMRERELRSSVESRRSMTKFVTILVIAASLEALVMVFQSTRDGIQYVLYPAGLFMAAMFALVALGSYQWLSSRIEHHDRDKGN